MTDVQFERAVQEYARWKAIPEGDRSPAPAWWWGPAFEARALRQPMPESWCSTLGLSKDSSFADGANVFLASFVGQTVLPWPDSFPGRPKNDAPV